MYTSGSLRYTPVFIYSLKACQVVILCRHERKFRYKVRVSNRNTGYFCEIKELDAAGTVEGSDRCRSVHRHDVWIPCDCITFFTLSICLCNYKCKFNLFCCQPYNLATKGHRTSVRFQNSLELTSPYFLRCVFGENINKNMHVALIIRFQPSF